MTEEGGGLGAFCSYYVLSHHTNTILILTDRGEGRWVYRGGLYGPKNELSPGTKVIQRQGHGQISRSLAMVPDRDWLIQSIDGCGGFLFWTEILTSTFAALSIMLRSDSSQKWKANVWSNWHLREIGRKHMAFVIKPKEKNKKKPQKKKRESNSMFCRNYTRIVRFHSKWNERIQWKQLLSEKLAQSPTRSAGNQIYWTISVIWSSFIVINQVLHAHKTCSCYENIETSELLQQQQ